LKFIVCQEHRTESYFGNCKEKEIDGGLQSFSP
jgi:hypothetical protein